MDFKKVRKLKIYKSLLESGLEEVSTMQQIEEETIVLQASKGDLKYIIYRSGSIAIIGGNKRKRESLFDLEKPSDYKLVFESIYKRWVGKMAYKKWMNKHYQKINRYEYISRT